MRARTQSEFQSFVIQKVATKLLSCLKLFRVISQLVSAISLPHLVLPIYQYTDQTTLLAHVYEMER